jgi:hypothetical protein
MISISFLRLFIPLLVYLSYNILYSQDYSFFQSSYLNIRGETENETGVLYDTLSVEKQPDWLN